MEDFSKIIKEQKDEKDFKSKKTQSWLYAIGIVAFIIYLISGLLAFGALVYLALVFCCKRWYNKTLAKIIEWFAALLILGIIAMLISTVFNAFS